MSQRNWLGTLNNPSIPAKEYLEMWFTMGKATYVCGQLERGAEGTEHIQFFLNYKSKCRLAALKKICLKAHFEPIKINNGAHTYCMKEETRIDGPWEFGVKPVQRNSKHDWEEVKKNAINGDLDKIPGDIFIKHYSNIKAIKKDYMKRDEKDYGLRGIWITGVSGIGKSKLARRMAEDYEGIPYPKMLNKWWDGYQNERVAIMEDIDPEIGGCLKHHLKIWMDRYSFIAESKQGALAPNYDLLIVTSQYTIEEIFTSEKGIRDDRTIDAISRRCIQIRLSHTPLGVLKTTINRDGQTEHEQHI